MERVDGEPLIERPSPQLTARIIGREAILRYDNATLYMFSDQYDQMNHIYTKPEGWECPVRIYGTPQVEIGETALWLAMMDNAFPYIYQPYPTDGDIEAYLQHEANQIDRELEDGL